MSMVKMTVRQCWDLGLWDNYCEYSGCNPYAINEGQIDYDDEIEFDSEFKKEDNEEYISPIIYHIEFYSADNGNKSNMSVIIDRENYKGDLLKQISDILNEGNIITSLKLAEDDE